jgi:hypothetical protein
MSKELNLPPFYVGQRVVCNTPTPTISKGLEYRVIDMYYVSCCKTWGVCVGVEAVGKHYCPAHNTTHNPKVLSGVYHDAEFFSPIEENFQSISIEKVLEKETPLIGVN